MKQQTTETDWIIGHVDTSVGKIPVISHQLTYKDHLGNLKVRFDIQRKDYKVPPGLYAIGMPDSSSPVLVSANYKLTFDTLRKELDGLNLWLLILDTDGVNVWCSAGKGTFGTMELVKRIALTKLPNIVEHRDLILPQLAASGVCAHDVKKRTGFEVHYGTVRAKDLKAYLAAGMVATEEMKTVQFSTWDRFVLTPVELVHAGKMSIPIFAVLFLINMFAKRQFLFPDFLCYCAAIISGTVLTPVLLPWIPFRAFAVKGWVTALAVIGMICQVNGWFAPENLLLGLGYMLALPAYAAYFAMNFTGSTTYTSHTGVTWEIKRYLPFIFLFLFVGCILLLIQAFGG